MTFSIFLGGFMDCFCVLGYFSWEFLGFLGFFFDFWDFWLFWILFLFFGISLGFFGLFLKLLRLLLKGTEVTTEHQIWPKIGQNSIINSFLAKSPWPKAKALRRSWK